MLVKTLEINVPTSVKQDSCMNRSFTSFYQFTTTIVTNLILKSSDTFLFSVLSLYQSLYVGLRILTFTAFSGKDARLKVSSFYSKWPKVTQVEHACLTSKLFNIKYPSNYVYQIHRFPYQKVVRL